MKKSEKIFVVVLSLILVGILATLGYLYYEKANSLNEGDIPFLKKSNQTVVPTQIEGSYFTNSPENGYYQKLEIAKNTGDSYRIAIRYGGATKGCSFDAMGNLVGNKIEIPLKDIEQGLKQNMIITLTSNKAIISSSEVDNLELKYFCSGGTSLAGEYIKETTQTKK